MKQTLTENQITELIEKSNPRTDKCHFCGKTKLDEALNACYTCTQIIIECEREI